MKLHLVLALAAASLLSACTDADWSHGMSFVGLDDTPDIAAQPVAAPRPVAQTARRPVAQVAAAQAAPAQAAQASGVNPFCAAVARQDADGHGFDAATQQGMFVRSYQQCVTVFGNVAEQ